MSEPRERSDHTSKRHTERLGQVIVDAIDSLLDADTIEFLTAGDDELVVSVESTGAFAGSEQGYSLWTSLPGQAYRTGRACIIDDLLDVRSTAVSTSDVDTSIPRSLCCVPVGDSALVLASAARPGAFSDTDLALTERLIETIVDAVEPVPKPALDGGIREPDRYVDQLQEIADILSHDLKNPLSIAHGHLQLARETGEEQYLERVSHALDRIETLIDEVVHLARTGLHIDQSSMVDLDEMATAAWSHLDTKEATLEIDDSMSFTASESGVTHILENLFENAITHGGPEVTVRIGTLDDGFYVEDDGVGIPDGHLDSIFERGYSLDAGSSGLGLHIAVRIAEAHDWLISANTGATGGARFEVTGIDG